MSTLRTCRKNAHVAQCARDVLMQKLTLFGLAVLFTGCQAFKKSDTWSKVTAHRVDTRGASDPSRIYAEDLSRELVASQVEHRVVTYQYRYRPRLREEALAQQTAVIYKDPTRPEHPWWLKDHLTSRPVWLPNVELSRQVAFYAQRDIEVVDARGLAAADGKTNAGTALLAKDDVYRANEPERLSLKNSRMQTARERSRLLASLQKLWQSIFPSAHGRAVNQARTQEVASR